MLIDGGHSRAPVVGPAGLDDVIGVVHLRDLVDADGPVDALARPGLFLPETLRVSDALRQLRLERQQLAMVVDERGAIDGIITMEDLVEEIVGEIYDETDRDVQAVVREPDGGAADAGFVPDPRPAGHRLRRGPPGRGRLHHDRRHGAGRRWATSRPSRVRWSTLPEFTAEVVEVTGPGDHPGTAARRCLAADDEDEDELRADSLCDIHVHRTRSMQIRPPRHCGAPPPPH